LQNSSEHAVASAPEHLREGAAAPGDAHTGACSAALLPVGERGRRSARLISSIDSWMREEQETKDRMEKERRERAGAGASPHSHMLAQVNNFFSPRKAMPGWGVPRAPSPARDQTDDQRCATMGGQQRDGPSFFLGREAAGGEVKREGGGGPRFFLEECKGGAPRPDADGDLTGIGILVSAHCNRWRGLDCYAVAISQVAAKSAAERGGLQVGDILTEIDGHKLSTTATPAGGSDSETTKELIRRTKALIVGPRGASVSIRGTRQHFMGQREPFQVSILRM